MVKFTSIKKKESKLYPVDYLTYYDKNKKLPNYLKPSLQRTHRKGFTILQPITPDSYDVPNSVKPFHAPFKHIREYTIPNADKLFKNNKDAKGFFIAEGDIWLNDDYTFDEFLKENHKEPIWLGYKKKMKHYIVGNFFIYIPKTHYKEFREKVMKQTRNIYSDRFFTRLQHEGFLKIRDKTCCNEIQHVSAVAKGVRPGYVLSSKDKVISKLIDKIKIKPL